MRLTANQTPIMRIETRKSIRISSEKRTPLSRSNSLEIVVAKNVEPECTAEQQLC